MTQVAAGKKLIIVLRVEDRETDLYPRAIVRNSVGIEVAGSPVDLAHVGNGVYINADLIMSGEFMTAAIDIYEDAGHTIISESYPDGEAQLFTKDHSFELISDTLIAKIEGLTLPGAAISAAIVQDEIAANVAASLVAVAEVENEDVIAGLVQDGRTVGQIETTDINVSVD